MKAKGINLVKGGYFHIGPLMATQLIYTNRGYTQDRQNLQCGIRQKYSWRSFVIVDDCKSIRRAVKFSSLLQKFITYIRPSAIISNNFTYRISTNRHKAA